jgi:NADH-quinone oxidoreductase subunit J
MVFVLFVIMLFQRSPRELGLLSDWGPAMLAGVVFLAVTVAMILKDPGSGVQLQSAVVQPRDFGRFLFDRYWLAIEIVSLLLLVALVAIIQLGKRKGADGEEAEKRVNPIGNSSRCDSDSKPSGVFNPTPKQHGTVSNGVKEGSQ